MIFFRPIIIIVIFFIGKRPSATWAIGFTNDLINYIYIACLLILIIILMIFNGLKFGGCDEFDDVGHWGWLCIISANDSGRLELVLMLLYIRALGIQWEWCVWWWLGHRMLWISRVLPLPLRDCVRFEYIWIFKLSRYFDRECPFLVPSYSAFIYC